MAYKTSLTDLEARGLPGLSDYDRTQEELLRMSRRTNVPPSFDTKAAGAGGAAQLALADQLMQGGSKSIAGLQGTGALSQNAQQALAASAAGQRGVLATARGAASGIVGDSAQAGLREYMNRRQLAGSVAGAARGADLDVADRYSQLALKQLAQNQAYTQSAARIGQGAFAEQANLAREADKLHMRQLTGESKKKDSDFDAWIEWAKMIAKAAAGGG